MGGQQLEARHLKGFPIIFLENDHPKPSEELSKNDEERLGNDKKKGKWCWGEIQAESKPIPSIGLVLFTYIQLISMVKVGRNIADMGPMGRNTFMNLKSAAQCQLILIFDTRKHHQNFQLCVGWKTLNGQKNKKT